MVKDTFILDNTVVLDIPSHMQHVITDICVCSLKMFILIIQFTSHYLLLTTFLFLC